MIIYLFFFNWYFLLKEGVSVQVRLISEFVSYGTTSLLEDTLLEIVQPDLPQALTALEVCLSSDWGRYQPLHSSCKTV